MEKPLGVADLSVTVRKKAGLTEAEEKDPRIKTTKPTLDQIGDIVTNALRAHFPGLDFNVSAKEWT